MARRVTSPGWARWIPRWSAVVAVLIAGQTVGDAAQASVSETSAPHVSVGGAQGSASDEVAAASRAEQCFLVVAMPTGTSPIAQVDVVTGEVLFLHGDSIGSTRSVTDASGAVVAEFDYSLYGTVSTVSGDADATRFLFAGEYRDPSGDYYLRNRVYDPATASFLSVDPALAATGMPYAYTAGNPLQATDPLGLNWLSDTLTSPAFWASTVVFLGCELATGGTGSVLCLAGAGAVYGALDYVETTPEECRTLSGLFTHTALGAVTGVVGGRVFGPVASKVLGVAGRGVLKIAPTFVREALGGVAEAASARLSAFTEAFQQRTGNLFAQARAALADDTGSIQIGRSVASSGVGTSASDVPTVVFSRGRAPGIAQNFDNAVANGAPTQLNRVSGAVRDANRRAALRGEAPAPVGQSLDEYPFACSAQGGCGSFVRAVPAGEQSYQGGVLSRFFNNHVIGVGDPFNVVFGP